VQEDLMVSLKLVDHLAERLIEQKIVTPDQMEKAKKVSSEKQVGLGSQLVKSGYVSQDVLVDFLSKSLKVPYVNLSDYDIDPKAVCLVSPELARRYKFIPLFKIEDTVTIAMADPLDLFALDRIKFETGHKVVPVICSEKSVLAAIDRFQPRMGDLTEALEQFEKSAVEFEDEERLSKVQLERIAEGMPVVRLVNTLISQAIQHQASDIHIEPREEDVSVRLRVDGVLRRVASLPRRICLPVVSRMKIMSRLDITQRRKPQDGRISFKYQGNPIDLRVSVYPTILGEKIVIRILDLRKAHLRLEDMGMPPAVRGRFEELIRKPNGIILVTGPTGSGKTTTLYAALNSINSEDINIITVEDPVEYHLENVAQANVDERYGITFAEALRSMLRQDPNVILVGEIRDAETAQLAVRAALTGHLVFSTLHTRNAVGAITRLLDMGVEPFLISSTLLCILAQRLVRVICPECRRSYCPPDGILKELSQERTDGMVFYEAPGCPACDNKGYKGRTALYELLVPTQKIHEMIMSRASAEDMRRALAATGTRTLMDEGIERAKEGVTTVEEVIKATKV
jgi:type IV pilus assembly protein PilB